MPIGVHQIAMKLDALRQRSSLLRNLNETFTFYGLSQLRPIVSAATDCLGCDRLSLAPFAIYVKIFGALDFGNLDHVSGEISLLVSHRIVLQVSTDVTYNFSLPTMTELDFLSSVFMLLVQSPIFLLFYKSKTLLEQSSNNQLGLFTKTSMDFDTDAVVIGGGFSGILAVHQYVDL